MSVYGKDQATIMNVLGKMPFDYRGHSVEEMNAAVAAGVKAAQELNAANDAKRGDPNWHVEYEELERRFKGLPSTKDADQALKALEDSFETRVKEMEFALSQARDSKSVNYMSAFELSETARSVAEKQTALDAYKASMRIPLARARQLAKDAKEWNPKRKRYEELKARAQAIEAATSTSRRPGFARQEQVVRPGPVDRMTF